MKIMLAGGFEKQNICRTVYNIHILTQPEQYANSVTNLKSPHVLGSSIQCGFHRALNLLHCIFLSRDEKKNFILVFVRSRMESQFDALTWTLKWMVDDQVKRAALKCSLDSMYKCYTITTVYREDLKGAFIVIWSFVL